MAIDANEMNKLQKRSVQDFPTDTSGAISIMFSLASAADSVPAWGDDPTRRDQELRKFARSESWLASTIASLAARNAAFSWTLEGPPRTCARIQDMLHASNFGSGWTHLMQQISTDIMSQDNGAFVELIRQSDSPTAPIIGLAHKDAGQCVRTGNLEYPVVYTDRQGGQHKLAWYQVMDFVDNPSTQESMYGVGLCAVSRALEYAQLLRDIITYQREKASGRNPSALHVVSGVATQQISDVLTKAASNADNKGQLRWQLPAVLGTVDPTAKVDVATILLKSLPDGFDMEQWMKWFIALMALAFGCEFQDLAPLTGGSLGSSQQSTILHMKARGKGPELFQKMIEHRFNFYVLPSNVTFKFTEKDSQAEQTEADVKLKRAERYASYVTMGMPLQVVAQIMEDEQELKPEYLAMLAQEDVTNDDTLTDDTQPNTEEDIASDQVIDEDQQAGQQQGQPTPAGQTQQVPPPTSKALSAEDYGGRQRMQLEREYAEEMETVLAVIGKELIGRIKREVNETEGD